jgi:uncharacterized protein
LLLHVFMNPTVISKQTARRFVLGRQGLWPGRRWKGKKGTAEALRSCEAVQLDPLNVSGRSQDIVLHSRVLGYKPEYLYQVAYEDREFFDYGGWLAMYPMSDLPYWRIHMERRSHVKSIDGYMLHHQELFERVRAELRARGPLGNRGLDGNPVANNYHGRKDTAVVMYFMWLSGELMMHHREGFDRVYDFRENIAPKEYDFVADVKETEKYFARKVVAFMGLKNEGNMRGEMNYYMRQNYSIAEMKGLLKQWKEAGTFAQVRIEGGRETYLVLYEDMPALESLERGGLPAGWRPKGTTTLEEVTLLSPLDVVSARGRAKRLFDFEYKWEVYVPAPKRRWGYYVLPILYGDDLVARLDPKLDRATMTLQIKGFWHEDEAPVKDAAFADALAHGLVSFARFLGAGRINIAALHPPALRRAIKPVLSEALDVSTRSLE